MGVLLQEGKELWSDLGQHGRHVVSGQGVAVVQIHYRILQVAKKEGKRKRSDNNGHLQRQWQAQGKESVCGHLVEKKLENLKVCIYNLKLHSISSKLLTYKSTRRTICTNDNFGAFE